MADLPELPHLAGATWRSWTLDDVPALTAHMARVNAVERLDHVSGADSYRWLLNQEGFDPGTDTRTAVDADGTVLAETGVFAQVTEQGGRAFLWAEAAPPHTRLRPEMVRWAEARARQILAGVAPGLDRVIRLGVEEHRAGFRNELEELGFEARRSFATMRRPLQDLPSLPALPDGVTVEGWSPERDEATRLANNESFADHWGTFPMSSQMWTASYRDSGIFRPDLSFVAVTTEGVVSFCMVEVEEEENARSGHRDMYLHRVGTLRSHRRLRLASHLMLRSMQAALETGLERAVLDVDESSHTNAGEVYLRLGFVVTERSIHYLKQG